jgi:type I restriction enzyme M protein
MSSEPQIRNHAAFIWSVADKLRGVYKQSEYGRVILPLVVLRRLDCVLEPTKADVLARAAKLKGKVMDDNEDIFKRILDEPAFRQTVLDHYAERLYGRLRAEHDQLGLTEAP